MIGLTTIAERRKSAFPVSIGTSLALEALFQVDEPSYDPAKTIKPVSIKPYKEIWFNLYTIVRNLLDSVANNGWQSVPEDTIYTVLESEIDIITQLCLNESNGTLTPVFYFANYDNFYKHRDKRISVYEDKTPKQLLTTKVVTGLIEAVIKKNSNHRYFDNEIVYKGAVATSILVVTSFPIDLLSRTQFRVMDLLETHTGVLKTRTQWWTKYGKIKDQPLDMLPFTRKLLYLFGDSNMIKPIDIRFRKLIVDIAKERRWSPLTTEDKIRMSLDLDIRERYLYDTYLEI